MNSLTPANGARTAAPSGNALAGLLAKAVALMSRLQIDFVEGTFQLGLPRLSESAVDLFRDEYQLPLLAPELGATLAALGEHALPLLILLGLGTRFAALGLLVMTAVIQLLVYPGAWPTHGVWAAVLLWLMALGPGVVSLDHWLARRRG